MTIESTRPEEAVFQAVGWIPHAQRYHENFSYDRTPGQKLADWAGLITFPLAMRTLRYQQRNRQVNEAEGFSAAVFDFCTLGAAVGLPVYFATHGHLLGIADFPSGLVAGASIKYITNVASHLYMNYKNIPPVGR